MKLNKKKKNERKEEEEERNKEKKEQMDKEEKEEKDNEENDFENKEILDAEDEDVPLFSLQGKKKKKKKKLDEDESSSSVIATGVPGGVGGIGVGGDRDGALPWEGSDRDYNYTELLERIFTLLREKNPSLSVKKRHVMPPPQLVRVGTRKTMWANFAPICQLMHRQPEHVLSFLLAELGTEGSIDGNQRCVMKGRYVPKQIESILKKYILEYVTCHMCRNPETSLTRDSVTRLYFIQCESCGSRRSVAPIKSGFHATMRTDRRKTKNEAK